MHIAACKNNENMISFLLDMGANPNVVNQQGQTPVMKAAEYGHIQSIQVLADAGSDMTGTIDTIQYYAVDTSLPSSQKIATNSNCNQFEFEYWNRIWNQLEFQ